MNWGTYSVHRKMYIRNRKFNAKRLPFSMQYYSYSEEILKIIKKHWTLLQCAYPEIKKISGITIKGISKESNIKGHVNPFRT